MLNNLIGFLKSIPDRITKNPRTTVGGTAWGLIGAALVTELERVTGCHFTTAFANIDYIQLFIFASSLLTGALNTDANKIINDNNKSVTVGS